MMQRAVNISDLPNTDNLSVSQVAVAWNITLKVLEHELEFARSGEQRKALITNTFIEIHQAIANYTPIPTEARS